VDRKTKKLIKDLTDPDPKVRYQAVKDLGMMGDPDLLPELEKVADLDKHREVRDLAYKAVRTLRALKQRQEQAARRAQLGEEDEGSHEYEWKILASDIGVSNRPAFTPAAAWDYNAAVEESLTPPPEAEAPAGKKAKPKKVKVRKERRTRASYRIMLWLSVCVAILAAAILAYYRLEEAKDAPTSRPDALVKLNAWLGDHTATAEAYREALNAATLDCVAVRQEARYQVAVRPKWAAPDKKHQGGLDEFFDLMTRIENNLGEARRRVEAVCQDVDQRPNDAWPSESVLTLLDDVERDTAQAVTLLDEAGLPTPTPTLEATPTG
jgi:hypothetical protein